jgi:hypothetical protein
MIVVQACYTLIINGPRIPVKAGEGYFIQRGVPALSPYGPGHRKENILRPHLSLDRVASY